MARVYARVAERGPMTARALEASLGARFTTSANPRTIVAFYLSKLKTLGLLTTTPVRGGSR